MPYQGQNPTLVFLRDLEREVPKPGELLDRRHDTNYYPCPGDRKPNHALRTISVDYPVRAIMSRNPIWQRSITIQHPDRNPN